MACEPLRKTSNKAQAFGVWIFFCFILSDGAVATLGKHCRRHYQMTCEPQNGDPSFEDTLWDLKDTPEGALEFLGRAVSFLLECTQQHIWCGHSQIAAEVLVLFEERNINPNVRDTSGELAAIRELHSRMNQQLTQCYQWLHLRTLTMVWFISFSVIAYHTGKTRLMSKHLLGYTEESVRPLMDSLNRWEVHEWPCLLLNTCSVEDC